MIAYTKQLNIYTQHLLPLIQGRDLIKLGLTPSKEFSTILEKIYDMQMQGKFDGYSYEKVLEYCSLNFKNKTYSKK
jgi:tRNA nucleotidyltransferase (CCA-adding enzyme)